MTSSLPPAEKPAAAPAQALRFGRCVLHPHSRELWRDGEPVEVQRLALDVLLYLVAHPGRDVSKEELLREVWGEAEVTESVVARAVMKLRRAIGDEQQPPTLLRTVHGVGYRWLVAPTVSAAAGGPLPVPAVDAHKLVALLPVQVSGDSPWTWVQQGLPALLSHLLDSEGPVRLVDAAHLHQADLPHASWPARAANVRTALGAAWVIQAELEAQSDLLRLHLRANPDQDSGISQTLEAPSVPALAEQTAAWMISALSASACSAQALEAATLELLARSSHEAQHGHLSQARALVLEAQRLSPHSPVVCLEVANVLRLTGELADAEAAAEQGWSLISALPPGQQPSALALRIRLSQAKLAHAGGELQRARRYMDWAELLIEQVPGRQDRAEWAIFSGSLAHSMGDLARAQTDLEAAVGLLAGSDNLLLQVRARCLLADVLGQRGLMTRASELLQRAQHLLARLQAEPTRASVLLYWAALNRRRRYLSLALVQLDQVRAVYERVGHAYTVWYCRTTRVELLTELGQLSSAEDEATKLMADAREWPASSALPVPDVDRLMPLRLAQIEWLRGDHRRSLQQSMAALPAAMKSEYLQGVLQPIQLRLLAQCLSLGWAEHAAALQATLATKTEPLVQARLQAILAMAAGDVDRTMQILRDTWDSGPSHASTRMDAAIDLVWLALSCGKTVELESLMAHIDDECDEYLPAIVVRARYLDHQGHRTNALVELQRARQMHAESAMTLVTTAIETLQRGDGWPQARGLLTDAVRS